MGNWLSRTSSAEDQENIANMTVSEDTTNIEPEIASEELNNTTLNIQSILDEDLGASNVSSPLVGPVLESEVVNGTALIDTPEASLPEFDFNVPSESEDVQPAFVLDVHYMKDRGIIISQSLIFLMLVLLKYCLHFCGIKMKGTQSKLVGSLLMI